MKAVKQNAKTRDKTGKDGEREGENILRKVREKMRRGGTDESSSRNDICERERTRIKEITKKQKSEIVQEIQRTGQ